jgi:L-fuconolactonase
MRIDAHQHFWRIDRGDYGWLTPDLALLYRDFMPANLAPLLKRHGIDGTILVQAAPTTAETAFLLDVAEGSASVLGVVGWVDFASPSAPEDIARLAANPWLVGLRPMIQDIADDNWMLRPDLTPAFQAMIRHDLTFDALVLPRHLPRLRALLARHPDLRTIIDHGAKPEIADKNFEGWAQDMAALARDTTAFCKLSGLVTEAAPNWAPADIAPYAAHLQTTFGADRLIWGSDWPVLTLAASYDRWVDLAAGLFTDPRQTKAVFGGNAIRAYHLNLSTQPPS